MSAGFAIVAQDHASPKLAVFIAGLRDKKGLHQAIGLRGQSVVRDHLIGLAATRHDTATALGATPSGHLAQAAEKTTLASNEVAATVSINQPGLGRALHDVNIRPTTGQFLTIALVAAAYNQRAYRVPGLFRPVKSGAVASGHRQSASGRNVATFDPGDKMRVLAKATPGGGLVFWYALVPKVHQAQDRSLLPSDEQLGQASIEGTLDYVKSLRSAGSNLGGAN